MNTIQLGFSAIVPALFVLLALTAILKKKDIFPAIKEGAKEGLTVTIGIVPSLVALFSVIYMFRASGAMDYITGILEPAAKLVGIPPECVPLMLIRPLSGSGALLW